MVLSTRAGLVTTLFTAIFCVGLLTLAGAAPITHRESGLSYGYDYMHHQISACTFSARQSEGASMSTRSVPNTLCQNNSVEMVTLVRRGLGAKIRNFFRKIGHGIAHAFHKVVNSVKNAVHTVVHAVVHVAKKIAHGVVTVAKKVAKGVVTVAKKVAKGVTTAAKKVWHFAKTVGAAAVKFGMKLYATGEKIVAKVAGFFPEFGGKAIERALSLHAKVVNAISDKIHVKLPGKLAKGVSVLNKINKYSGYVPL